LLVKKDFYCNKCDFVYNDIWCGNEKDTPPECPACNIVMVRYWPVPVANKIKGLDKNRFKK